jgi:hypothetical protein
MAPKGVPQKRKATADPVARNAGRQAMAATMAKQSSSASSGSAATLILEAPSPQHGEPQGTEHPKPRSSGGDDSAGVEMGQETKDDGNTSSLLGFEAVAPVDYNLIDFDSAFSDIPSVAEQPCDQEC